MQFQFDDRSTIPTQLLSQEFVIAFVKMNFKEIFCINMHITHIFSFIKTLCIHEICFCLTTAIAENQFYIPGLTKLLK